MAQIANADAAVENVIFLAKVKDNTTDFSIHADGTALTMNDLKDWKLYRADLSSAVLGQSFNMSLDPTSLANLEELMIVVKYSFKINTNN